MYPADHARSLFQSILTQLAVRNSNVMPKKSFHVLARHVPRDEIDAEIREKLDVIGRVAGEAEGWG